MELTFQKSADRWIAEFEAHADFAIHIEGVLEGNVQLLQRHPAHGMYAVVSDSIKRSSYVNVYDYEVPVLIAPVFIKVSCATEPTFAAVTTDGEVIEIKAQSKEIEVTSNGTMDITPDAGFAYLNSVKVKTNVAGSGGGGGDTWRYFDVSRLDSNMKPMTFPFIVKSGNFIKTPQMDEDWTQVVAIGVDDSDNRVYIPRLGRTSWSRVMAEEGLTPEVMAQFGIIEITEDEFYYYDTIEFTTNGRTRRAERGMTWEQYNSSVYNDGWINVKDGKVTHTTTNYNSSPLKYYVEGEGKYYDVLPADVIIEGMNYTYIDE